MTEYCLLGLLGHPLSHSLSPTLHEAALQAAGLKGAYRLFDVSPENLQTEFKRMLALDLKGFNVTIPYKQDIYKIISKRTNEAKLTGAVNAVKVEKDGTLTGHNTDLIGFRLALGDAFDINLQGKTALIIGAGGSARAVVVALAQMGMARIRVRARDKGRVSSFIEEMQENLIQTNNDTHSLVNLCADDSIDDKKNRDEIVLVVNASPIGLPGVAAPSWLANFIDSLPDDCLCFDLVYSKDGSKPLFTQLATTRKLSTMDGLSMLIHQASYSFEYWTGISVPVAVMYKALNTVIPSSRPI